MEWEGWSGIAVGAGGLISGLYLGTRKQKLSEGTESFVQAEKLNTMLQEMVTMLKGQVDRLEPKVSELQKEVNTSKLKIAVLETEGQSCKKNNECLWIC